MDNNPATCNHDASTMEVKQVAEMLSALLSGIEDMEYSKFTDLLTCLNASNKDKVATML